MTSPTGEISGLLRISHAEIKKRISQHKLFGLDPLQEQLFQFCSAVITASNETVEAFSFYDLVPSILLFGPPNTGKTTLCHLLFDRLKQEITNKIDFYTLDVAKMLDPALGQSSRNLEQAFEDLRKLSSKESACFLVLDELDSFCMSRSRVQEHDAIRRAMTALILELDKLHPSSVQNIILFGLTNVSELIDTAVMRRFSLKYRIDPVLCLQDFYAYLKYLGEPLKYSPRDEDIDELFALYKDRGYKPGDIKVIYKNLFINLMCESKKAPTKDRELMIKEKLFTMFSQEFSTEKHLNQTYMEFANGR